MVLLLPYGVRLCVNVLFLAVLQGFLDILSVMYVLLLTDVTPFNCWLIVYLMSSGSGFRYAWHVIMSFFFGVWLLF